LFSTNIIKNQATILNKKVVALSTAIETKINDQMREIISFINDQDEEDYVFPIDIIKSELYEQTTDAVITENMRNNNNIVNITDEIELQNSDTESEDSISTTDTLLDDSISSINQPP
jgi:hypothetical protein